MPFAETRIQLLHPIPGTQMPRIALEKYELIKAAILQVIPDDEKGIPFKGLAERVAEVLGPETLKQIGSVGWYTTSVKLDLEARGLIERLPGAGSQRLRRKA